MALGDDLLVFQEYAYSTMVETADQKINLFNEATNFAVTLKGGNNQGDETHMAFFKDMEGLVKSRNPYESVPANTLEMQHGDHVSIKAGRRTEPVNISQGMFDWIALDPKVAGVVYGEQLAEKKLQDCLNTALLSGVAAIQSVGDKLTYNYSDTGEGKLDRHAMARGAAIFEDRWEAIAAWIVHGASVHDVFFAALQNNERLFQFGNVSVLDDGFGRPIIATNSPSLTTGTGAGQRYLAMGLVSGGVNIEENDDFDLNVEKSNGQTNIQRSIQSEWSIQISVKGFAWNTATGGKAPTDTALATPESWAKAVTSYRDTAGVLVSTK